MYKLFKEKGYSDITLMNTDTYGEISLGRYRPIIGELLKKDGYDVDMPEFVGGKSIKSMDKWSLELSDEVAKELNNLASRGTKPPVRSQVSKLKQSKQPKQEIKAGVRIDLFDLIFNDED